MKMTSAIFMETTVSETCMHTYLLLDGASRESDHSFDGSRESRPVPRPEQQGFHQHRYCGWTPTCAQFVVAWVVSTQTQHPGSR